MRQGQQNHNKRMRNRNRKGPNPLTRSYESNGGDVKIRGTALHVAEKYVQLARDAQSSGDRVAGENYLQHAEHYFRIVAAAQAQMPQPQQFYRNDDGDGDEDDERDDFGNAEGGRFPQGQQGGGQPVQGGNPQGGQQGGQNRPPQGFEPQPYINGAPPNGGGQDQPSFDGDNGLGGNGGNGGRGDDQNRGHRHRRRRPYRDNYGERGDDQRSAAGEGQPRQPEVASEGGGED